MAKAINWPAAFRDEVIAEDTDRVFCAFRIGRLYYDGRFWSPDEVVDIRVDHRVVRKGVVQGDLKCCAIKDLLAEDFQKQKKELNSVDEVVTFLSENYQQPITPETEVTVVYYKNLPLDPDIMDVPDDPHM